MADFEDISGGHSMEDEIRLQEAIFKSLVKFGPVKNYVIVDKSGTATEFGLYTEYGNFKKTTASWDFFICDSPWEGQKVWKKSEVCNIDGSPVFRGCLFTDFEEFSKNPEVSMARLLSEEARDQLKSKI